MKVSYCTYGTPTTYSSCTCAYTAPITYPISNTDEAQITAWDSFLESCTKYEDGLSLSDIKMIKKHTTGATLHIHKENAELLLSKDPLIFDGIDVEFIDEDDPDYFKERN